MSGLLNLAECILAKLKRIDGRTIEELSYCLEVGSRDIEDHVKALEDNGLVHKDGVRVFLNN